MKENIYDICKERAVEGLRDIGRREGGNHWDRFLLWADKRTATCIARMLEISDEQIAAHIKEGRVLTSGSTNP